MFFHFYFAYAGDVLQMRCSSRSFVRICFCGAFVILHDRIFASCHQSHAIFRNCTVCTQCLCLCIYVYRLYSDVILFNQSLIIKCRPTFFFWFDPESYCIYLVCVFGCVGWLVLQWIDITYQPQIALNKWQKCIWNVCTWSRM